MRARGRAASSAKRQRGAPSDWHGMVTAAAAEGSWEEVLLAAAPILSTVNEMKQGAPIVRALHVDGFLARRCRSCVSRWAGLSFHHKAINVWGAQVSPTPRTPD